MHTERRRSTVLELPREIVFAALTDYGSYALDSEDGAFDCAGAEGDLAVAEFIWPVCLKDKFALEFIESRPESIAYTQTGQLRKWGLAGRWESRLLQAARARS